MSEGTVKPIFICLGTWDLTPSMWTLCVPGTAEGQAYPWLVSALCPRDGPLVSAVGRIQGSVRIK